MSTLSLGPPPVAAPLVAGPRPVVPATATATETARALRPVEGVARGDPLRNPSARERPVGPPPAFEVNVLEDLRERLRHAQDAADVSPETPPERPADMSEDSSPHLDKKV